MALKCNANCRNIQIEKTGLPFQVFLCSRNISIYSSVSRFWPFFNWFFLLVFNSLLLYLRSCNFHLFIEKNIYIFHMYSFLEYCRLLIITLFPETQFHVILVIAPYAKPRNCQNDDFSPADFCWESTWFLVIRDLAFESSDGYYTAAFWLLCLFMWS